MPITVLKTSSGVGAGSISCNINFIPSSPAADILVVAVQVVDSSAVERVVSSAELLDTNGDLVKDLIHIPEADMDDGEDFRTEFWYALDVPLLETDVWNPRVKVHMTGKCTDVTAGAIFMNGIDKNNPIEATQIGSNAVGPPSITITTQSNGAYVIDSLVSGESDGTKIRSVHIEIHKTDVRADTTGSQYVDAGDAGDQIMNWEDDDVDTLWIMSAVAIKAAVAAVAGKSFGYIF